MHSFLTSTRNAIEMTLYKWEKVALSFKQIIRSKDYRVEVEGNEIEMKAAMQKFKVSNCWARDICTSCNRPHPIGMQYHSY